MAYCISTTKSRVFVVLCGTLLLDHALFKALVIVTANLESQQLSVLKVGHGKSAINGKPLNKGDKEDAIHRDKVEVVTGKYIFRVNFYNDPVIGHLSDNSEVEINSVEIKDQMATNVASIFLKKSAIPKNGEWEDIDGGKLLIYTPYNIKNSSKIASYDLDGTLITTKSGKVYPKDKTDWELLNKERTIKKLKEYHEAGFKLVVFTNQAYIGKNYTRAPDFKEKIEDILKLINLPIQVFIATSSDVYRKPAPGMWDYLVNKKNDGIPVNIEESFFCGDAAGRPVSATRKKRDFACSDRLFAINLNLTFYTPEEHFLNQKACAYELPKFCPMSLISDNNMSDTPDAYITNKSENEVILMVGAPGSGKSHFVEMYLIPEGYVRVNRDTLGSWQKCVKLLERSLSDNCSVVIDNTNPDKESRLRFIEVARKFGINVRAFILSISRDHAKHNNKFRELTDPSHAPVHPAVINTYYAKYEEPSVMEGFSEIVKIKFIPQFRSGCNQKLYLSYLLES